MDGDGRPFLGGAAAGSIVRRANVAADDGAPIEALQAQLGPGPFALIALFCSPEVDFRAIAAQCSRAFPGAPVIGCTTAGEIGRAGYEEGTIVAVGLPRLAFSARTLLLDDLDALDGNEVMGRVIRTRAELAAEGSGWEHEFAFLLVDGLSLKEDAIASVLATALGPVPLFGGSAGDGVRFGETLVSLDGTVYERAAVLALVRTACPIQVFRLDHLKPTDRRMVVTKADPARRVVQMINAEPAAREYARIVGKDPGQLSPFTFAAHPVVVCLGGTHHVRSIQRVTEDGDLVFFSAIDEGLVLTVAEAADMVAHLDHELAAFSKNGEPDTILACDCILRRLEAGDKQMTRQLSDILAKHRVTGFSTYGEQYGAMHVNQTMTGVVIYPPPADRPE